MWTRLLTIVLEPAAQKAADRYSGELHRFSEAWDALNWLLARDPKLGLTQEFGGRTYRLYVQASDQIAKTPTIWVVFSADENQVVLHGVHASEFVDDDDSEG